MIELIAYSVDGDPYLLDIDQDEVILFNQMFLDLKDLGERRGSYTKSFSLPGTSRNNKFFGQYYDPTNQGILYSDEQEIRALLLEDSFVLLQGSLRLDSVDGKGDYYNVSIFGVVKTVKALLGESRLADINLSDWTHTLAQIPSTWTRSLFSGHMVYGCHDFGQGYGLYTDVGGVNTLINIKSSATPIELDKAVPAFRLVEILKRMFAFHDISLAGDWYTDTDNQEIYVQADIQADRNLAGGAGTQFNILADQAITTSVQTVQLKAQPGPDPDWNDSTYRFTSPYSGSITFVVKLKTYGIDAAQSNSIFLYRNAAIVASDVQTYGQDLNITYFGGAVTYGDVFRLDIQATSNWVNNKLTSAFSPGGFVTVYNVTSLNPQLFWGNHLQLDFFKSIIKIFNLVVRFNPDNPYELILQTWEDYMSSPDVLDWRDKVDVDSIKINPINTELSDPIYLSYSKGQDVLNRLFEEQGDNPFGAHEESLNIPYAQKRDEQIPVFHPAPTQEIIGAGTSSFANFIICKYYDDEKKLGYKSPGLQLMYYNGMKTVTTFYTTPTQGGATTAHTAYPVFSNFLFKGGGFAVIATSKDLNFDYWTPASDVVTLPTSLNLYNEHFIGMLRERYWTGNRIVELDVVLSSTDIQKFEFNNLILVNINGTLFYLRPLELLNYPIGRKAKMRLKAYIGNVNPS